MRNYYVPGEWNCICDRCGFKFKASELQEDWQGFRVCKEDFEMRHPQDFVRARVDRISVPWVRMDPPVVISVSSTPSGYYINGASINQFTLG